MPEMKDSGIEWIGEIPKEWEIKKLKYVSIEIASNGIMNPDISNYIGLENVVSYSNQLRKTETEYEKSVQKKCHEGNVLFGKLRPYLAKVIISPFDGFCTGEFLEFSNYQGDNRFLRYSILNPKFIEKVNMSTYGAKMPRANSKFIMNLNIAYPAESEQARIADFLDSKCSEIDALTADIQKEIEVLEEYKKSVITEAVTKGLNPNVEMKDSGIEWIGEIPKEWKINRIKYLFKSSKGLSITKENLIDEGLPVISYGQIHSKTNTGVDIDKNLLRFVSYDYRRFSLSKMERYDFAFADTSEDYDGCGNCVYKRTDDELYGGYHVVILKSINKQDNRFFAYLFQTDAWRKQIRTKVSGIKVFSVTQKIINEASVIIPPISEQARIADFLDSKCSEIDSIIADKREQLTTLEEYKKSVIYEYVTGKKEVTA